MEEGKTHMNMHFFKGSCTVFAHVMANKYQVGVSSVFEY